MNPGLSQPQFTSVAQRLFYLLGKMFELRQHRLRFQETEVRIEELGDTNGFTSNWNLSGIIPGTNTDANAEVFVHITDETPGANQAQVDLYMATGGGGGDKIATGSGNNSTTITLAAANSSGVTGTVDIGVVTASESNDVHRLRCFVDYSLRDQQVFDGSETRDSALLAKVIASNANAAASIKAAEGSLFDVFTECLKVYVAEKINSGASEPLTISTDNDDGAISLLVSGILEDLRAAMYDNTTAQTIRKVVTSVGTPAFGSQNQGLGSMAAPGVYEHALPGTITWRCNGEAIGFESFEVTLRRSDTGEILKAEEDARVGREFKSAKLGISSQLLERVFSKSGDDTHIRLSDVTDGSWSVDGETATYTDAGDLHVEITANSGGGFDISFYRRSTLQAGDLVAKAVGIANNEVFQASAQRRSGLTINGTAGSAMANGQTCTFNLNPFKSGPPADTVTVALTQTSAGAIQQFLATLVDEACAWYLNSAASSETLPDTLMTAGVVTLYGRN